MLANNCSEFVCYIYSEVIRLQIPGSIHIQPLSAIRSTLCELIPYADTVRIQNEIIDENDALDRASIHGVRHSNVEMYFDLLAQGSSFACNLANESYELDVLCYQELLHRTVEFSSYKLIRDLNLNHVDVSSVTNMSRLFSGMILLKRVRINRWDTSSVTDMSFMFEDCISLEEIDIPASNSDHVMTWCVSNVVTMRGMFKGCKNALLINVKNWDTSNVTDMSFMFAGCESVRNLNDVERFKTSQTTSESCWNTSKVTNMKAMFFNTAGLNRINLNRWDTSSVTDMSFMFYGCGAFIIKVSNFDMDSIETCESMFRHSDVKSLTLWKWCLDKNIVMDKMFYDCYLLKKLNIGTWDIDASESSLCLISDSYQDMIKFIKPDPTRWIPFYFYDPCDYDDEYEEEFDIIDSKQTLIDYDAPSKYEYIIRKFDRIF